MRVWKVEMTSFCWRVDVFVYTEGSCSLFRILLVVATKQACVGQMPELTWYRNQGKLDGRVCLAHTRWCRRDNAVAFCFNHFGHVGLICGNHDPACRWTSHDENRTLCLLWKLGRHFREWNPKMMLQNLALSRKGILFCKL